MDYKAWLHRAEAFVQIQRRGHWAYSIRIASPALPAELEWIKELLPTEFDSELQGFYGSASADCECLYYWQTEYVLNPVLPFSFNKVRGGVSFSSLNDLSFYTVMCHHWADDHEDESSDEWRADWTSCTPFIHFDDGDYMALRPSTFPGPRVVYLSHDFLTVTPISESFDQFLIDWEALGYIDAQCLAAYFVDETQPGRLQTTSELAVRWRDLLDREKLD